MRRTPSESKDAKEQRPVSPFFQPRVFLIIISTTGDGAPRAGALWKRQQQ